MKLYQYQKKCYQYKILSRFRLLLKNPHLRYPKLLQQPCRANSRTFSGGFLAKSGEADEIGLFTVTLSRSEGSVALGTEMLRSAQHDRAALALLPRPCGRPVQTAQTAHSYNQNHAHYNPIAVLKNTPQNVAYLLPIQ
jgi:hypothetical protein